MRTVLGWPGGAVVKNPHANAKNTGLIPGSGRSLGVENGNPLQYSCLENLLEGYSPWGHKKLDTTERLSMHACQSCLTGLQMAAFLQCLHKVERETVSSLVSYHKGTNSIMGTPSL